MSIQFLILSTMVIGLTKSLSCHPSCACEPSSNVCERCVFPGSQMDIHQRWCDCPDGYFLDSLDPFSCTLLFSGVGKTPALTLGPCDMNIAQEVNQILLLNEQFQALQGLVNVVRNIQTLDFHQTSLSNVCIEQIQTKSFFTDPLTEKIIAIPSEFIFFDSNTSKTIDLPFTFIQNNSIESFIDVENNTSEKVRLHVVVSNSGSELIMFTWDLYLYTHREIVNLLEIQEIKVSIVQRSITDLTDDSLITIVDLETQTQICTDPTCIDTRTNVEYQVGDIFSVKISFVDASYTKHLQFVSLYLKIDDNEIYDFTTSVNAQWNVNGIIISLPLINSSSQSIIQICTQIIPNSRFRQLQSPDTQLSYLTVSVHPSLPQVIPSLPQEISPQETSQANSNSSISLLCFLNSSILLLLLLIV